MRAALCLALALCLSACVAPQKISKARQDKARFDLQQDESAVNERCNRDSMPGTVQHFACRMSAGKPE
jgi:hypothetical protein